MRFAVINTIYESALKNKDICFLTGDLGHVFPEEFRKNLPYQYFNMGIAEQNMLGVAAGLALSGKKVYVYSIIPFVTLRALEQIKVDVCYQNLDVNIVGIGSGLVYGTYGNTHCAIEDIGVMRVLPNMKVISPANPLEAQQLAQQSLNIKGPTYFRIGRGKEPMPLNPYRVTFGKGHLVRKGKDITIFATGTILTEAEKAADLLTGNHISAEIINIHTIKPIDQKLIIDRIKNRKAVFSLEEHNVIGGLGAAIAEIVSESGHPGIIFKRFGVNDTYLKEIGQQSYLRNRHKIDGNSIALSIINSLKTH